MNPYAYLKYLQDWLKDLENGNWPRGRRIASRQAAYLTNVLIPRAEQRAEWYTQMLMANYLG